MNIVVEQVPRPYRDELKGMADASKITIEEFTLLNLFYENQQRMHVNCGTKCKRHVLSRAKSRFWHIFHLERTRKPPNLASPRPFHQRQLHQKRTSFIQRRHICRKFGSFDWSESECLYFVDKCAFWQHFEQFHQFSFE